MLILWAKIKPYRPTFSSVCATKPAVTVIIPCYNEERTLKSKIENTLQADYPEDRLEIIIVSDGSSDNTNPILKDYAEHPRIRTIQLPERKGKANALNTGLQNSSNDIIVFSDASILLEKNAISEIVRQFDDPVTGCISGEDHIAGGCGEGLYGRYELFLRNLESKVGSLVGASGSFYAQRRELCRPFPEGMAPDFLSVLNTVEQGHRAVSEPNARGEMQAVKSISDEFSRKVRTLLRGMTTLLAKKALLNPARFPGFAFILFSHKVMRWFVPFFMLTAFAANIFILEHSFYLGMLALQSGFYLIAILAWLNVAGIQSNVLGKVSLYFCTVNLAILIAWSQFLRGSRQELWEPSKR